MKRAIVTVIGRDAVGILARVSGICANRGVNVLEVTQSILDGLFAMIMTADVSNCDVPFVELADELRVAGEELGLDIRTVREDVFEAMHRI